MKLIINKIREKRCYNGMWKMAKVMWQKGESDELTCMMDTVKENFEEKEKEYNEAV